MSATCDNYGLYIKVKDNGIGIAPEIRPRMYDMFFKGTEYSKGNGLGLYIVMKSVIALGGEINVISEPGSFAEFTVFLPLNEMFDQSPLQIHQEELAVN